MTALEAAKASISLPDLMAQLGLGEHAKKSARCPFHEDRNNSFSVFKTETGDWAWNCFAGCGGGDAVAFLARAANISNGDACRRLIELTDARSTGLRAFGPVLPKPSQPSPPVPLPVMPDSVADSWTEGVDYVLAHPISAVRLAGFRGWPVPFAQYLIDCAAISMPLRYNERGIAFQVIAPEGERGSMTTRPVGYHIRLKGKSGEKASWQFLPCEKEHGHGIPPLPFILGDFETASLLVILEGQWDALSFALAAGWLGEGALWPAGVGLIGIRGLGAWKTFLRYYERFWPESANSLLIPDADDKGKQWYTGTECFATKLSKLCRKVAVVDCAPFKDFNDLLRSEKPGPEVIVELFASHGMAIEGEVLS